MGFKFQSKAMRAQKRNLFVVKLEISGQKFYTELKKAYIMESEIEPLCLCYVL
jgi:hypothetical protein